MKLRFLAFILAVPFLLSVAFAQNQQLTIEAIYADGGILGGRPRASSGVPDGTKVSYVQRDDSGEHGALYYIDLATGKPAVLVSSEKLSSLAPPVKLDQRRAAERSGAALFGGGLPLVARLQAPAVRLDGSALDVQPGYRHRGAGYVQRRCGRAIPSFLPTGERLAYVRKHDLYVRDIKRGQEDALTRDGDENLLNGEVDWVYREELASPQQLLLVARRQVDRLSADE